MIAMALASTASSSLRPRRSETPAQPCCARCKVQGSCLLDTRVQAALQGRHSHSAALLCRHINKPPRLNLSGNSGIFNRSASSREPQESDAGVSIQLISNALAVEAGTLRRGQVCHVRCCCLLAQPAPFCDVSSRPAAGTDVVTVAEAEPA